MASTLADLFSRLTFESRVAPIRTLLGAREMSKTLLAPAYQRNYVWDREKGSYFIESVLLGTEIPPLVFFTHQGQREVLDGRQRFETLLRFFEGHLQLGKLDVLPGLQQQGYQDLPESLQQVFLDTKLRILEFSVPAFLTLAAEDLDVVKREIFRRYNSGITPLKHAEVEKAIYISEPVTAQLRAQLRQAGHPLLGLCQPFFRGTTGQGAGLDAMLARLRLLLVMDQVPLSYYLNSMLVNRRRQRAVVDHFLGQIDDPDRLLVDFTARLQLLAAWREAGIDYEDARASRLLQAALFWGLSAVWREGQPQDALRSADLLDALRQALKTHAELFHAEKDFFSANVRARHMAVADVLSRTLAVDLKPYLSSQHLRQGRRAFISDARTLPADVLERRLHKADAATMTVSDLCDDMRMHRRLQVRPVYQRKEVCNRIKSAALIESMLLGMRLPPIFVFRRNDGVSEVVDGQQRLLSIIGFLGLSFLDDQGQSVKSDKDGFALTRLTVLPELNGKTFADLPQALQDRLLDFGLQVVEIREDQNPDFSPVDLFVRLNNKPYPIRDHSFEMWNAHVSRELIDAIREPVQRADRRGWFYVRRNGIRMENEELFATLVYHQWRGRPRTRSELNCKARDEITRVFVSATQRPEEREAVLTAVRAGNGFLNKLQALLTARDITPEARDDYLRTRLDNLLHISSRSGNRRFQHFYALWYLLAPINLKRILQDRHVIYAEIDGAIGRWRSLPAKVGWAQLQADGDRIASQYAPARREIRLKDGERAALLATQGNTCPLCGGPLFMGDLMEVDHIHENALGGPEIRENLQLTHMACNREKGARCQPEKYRHVVA